MKYLFWIGILFFGCKTLTPEQKALNDACKELEEKINLTWKYDSLEKHYNGDYRFLTELTFNENKYRDCMESKDTIYIINLFGNHYKYESHKGQYPYSLTYMTSKPCGGMFDKPSRCRYLTFYFKKGGEIEKVIFSEDVVSISK